MMRHKLRLRLGFGAAGRARTRPIATLAAISSLLGAVIAFSQAIPDLGFTTKVSPALVAQYTHRFGQPVPERFAPWMQFAKEQKSKTFSQRLDSAQGREADALQIVNDAINSKMKWLDDNVHWGVEDYWATPAESIASAGGDCEDYSIAKYYMLKELGVPLARLRITYVRALTLKGQAHMVLAYFSTPDAEPLILDNLDGRVRPASQRSDLDPVYSFNDDEVQIVRGGKRGRPSQIRSWLAVQERLVAESRT